MKDTLQFVPLVEGLGLWLGLGLVGLALLAAVIWPMGGRGFRLLAAALIGLGLVEPVLERTDGRGLDDVVLLIRDESRSARLGVRGAQIKAAAEQLRTEITNRDGMSLREVILDETSDNQGTRLAPTLRDALGTVPPGQLAGVVVLSDGVITDAEHLAETGAPLHLLEAGSATEWDRRLQIEAAPAYGILGEEVRVRLVLLQEGAVPSAWTNRPVPLELRLGNGTTRRVEVMPNRPAELVITPQHAGANLIELVTPVEPDELTAANNSALVDITGVRDRLRVLLVSGTPHAGERVWRNLLKSDSSVDLVHFTILRAPGKFDGVPVNELSLIAFPTRELFIDKIDEFDLIIFDRYRLQGILPPPYIANIARYVREGGAILVSNGPEYASVDSLYRSPLGEVLPAAPSARVIERPFTATISTAGALHPVTQSLGAPEAWGAWYRRVELGDIQGDVILEAEDEPLLVLDRVGRGRVAMLASDHIWLWARGHDGGGPHRDLLRRLAHWLMGEPDLDEERLTATATAEGLIVERRSMAANVPPVSITLPSGNVVERSMTSTAPGRFSATLTTEENGLFSLSQGEARAVAGRGPASQRELSRVIGATDGLTAAVNASGGARAPLADGLPDLRRIRPGRQSSGPGWIGLWERRATETTTRRRQELLPAWALLILVGAMLIGGWAREGRA